MSLQVTGNSSLQSWQSESYTEEACCAAEQDTEQMPPTRVAEYFFSDIFTEVEEQEWRRDVCEATNVIGMGTSQNNVIRFLT